MKNEWTITLSSDLASSLALDFQSGLILNSNGQRQLTEETVAHINGLKVEIFSNEHPPPHFRVIYAGETANYYIKNCQKLNGGLAKWDRNIKKWHAEHKQDLIASWDRTRPSDCPVGPYKE